MHGDVVQHLMQPAFAEVQDGAVCLGVGGLQIYFFKSNFQLYKYKHISPSFHPLCILHLQIFQSVMLISISIQSFPK